MYYDFLKIPKVISEDEYSLNKLEYSLSYTVEKRKNFFILFPKKELEEQKYFFNIFDLSAKIAKKYPDHLYVIVEKNNISNFLITVGNTVDINNPAYYSKHKILASEITSNKILDLIDIAANMLNIKNIVIFNTKVNKNDATNILSLDPSYQCTFDAGLNKYFHFIPVKEKTFRKTSPVLFALVAFGLMYFLANAVSSRINNEKRDSENKIIKKLNTNIKKQEQRIKQITKRIANYKKIDNQHLRIYRGENDGQ